MLLASLTVLIALTLYKATKFLPCLWRVRTDLFEIMCEAASSVENVILAGQIVENFVYLNEIQIALACRPIIHEKHVWTDFCSTQEKRHNLCHALVEVLSGCGISIADVLIICESASLEMLARLLHTGCGLSSYSHAREALQLSLDAMVIDSSPDDIEEMLYVLYKADARDVLFPDHAAFYFVYNKQISKFLEDLYDPPIPIFLRDDTKERMLINMLNGSSRETYIEDSQENRLAATNVVTQLKKENLVSILIEQNSFVDVDFRFKILTILQRISHLAGNSLPELVPIQNVDVGECLVCLEQPQGLCMACPRGETWHGVCRPCMESIHITDNNFAKCLQCNKRSMRPVFNKI
jgi:hypothetical protein